MQINEEWEGTLSPLGPIPSCRELISGEEDFVALASLRRRIPPPPGIIGGSSPGQLEEEKGKGKQPARGEYDYDEGELGGLDGYD